MSPEQRQEWEDDEEALRRETAAAHAPAPESTESDERAARVERYAKAIFLSQDGWPIAWSDLHEDVQAGYLDEAKVAIGLADSELAEAKREIARLHRDALAEAQAYRQMFARAQEAEGKVAAVEQAMERRSVLRPRWNGDQELVVSVEDLQAAMAAASPGNQPAEPADVQDWLDHGEIYDERETGA